MSVYFYNRDERLTLAFVKNLCFSNSAAVCLNRKQRHKALQYVRLTTGESNGKKNKRNFNRQENK